MTLSVLLSIGKMLALAAHAQGGEELGTGNHWSVENGETHPAVIQMWGTVCDVLPFCNVGANAPILFASKIVSFIFEIITGIAVLVLIYAAIKLIISQGNDEALGEAKKIGLWALGGVALSITAQAVVLYFRNVLLPGALG
jgi:hypothetical protein